MHDGNESRFWSSQIARFLYIVSFMALASHRLWLMYVPLLILLFQIMKAILKWTEFIGSDPDLASSIAYFKRWTCYFISKAKHVMNSEYGGASEVMFGMSVVGASMGARKSIAYLNPKSLHRCSGNKNREGSRDNNHNKKR